MTGTVCIVIVSFSNSNNIILEMWQKRLLGYTPSSECLKFVILNATLLVPSKYIVYNI